MEFTITISNEIKEKLSVVRLAILSFEATVEASTPRFWASVDEASHNLRETTKAEDITKIGTITETRKAYKLCGKDPSRYRPAADSLIRRIVKGNDLYKVNNVVDVLNLVSLQSGISIGGYNLEKIQGDARLSIGKANDVYSGIGRGELNIEGLPVLRDEVGVFGSPTSDSERTMIGNMARSISFVFFDFGKSDSLRSAVQSCKCLLQEHCAVQNTDYHEVSYIQK